MTHIERNWYSPLSCCMFSRKHHDRGTEFNARGCVDRYGGPDRPGMWDSTRAWWSSVTGILVECEPYTGCPHDA